METGKKSTFSKIKILIVISFLSINLYAQSSKPEEKALLYFCGNKDKISEALKDVSFRFSGYTTGRCSDVYDIADCLGDIDLITNNIPNKTYLDSIEQNSMSLPDNAIEVPPPVSCSIITKRFISFFKRRGVFELRLYNSIIYNGQNYVEILLVNKKQEMKVICIEFNSNGEVSKHYTSSFIY